MLLDQTSEESDSERFIAELSQNSNNLHTINSLRLDELTIDKV